MQSFIDTTFFVLIAAPFFWLLFRLYVSIVQYELKQLERRREEANYKERQRLYAIAFKEREERMYAAGAAYYNAATDQYYNKDHMSMEEV